ncbi:MAG TPA: hypothetical protein VFB42_13990 [Gaiellaceae bacterium]|nr:hypothetical protein [Gaiellaceae bacterium]
MSNRKARGDERLIHACLVAARLCAERVPAAERLEAALGPGDARRLVRALTRGAPGRREEADPLRLRRRTAA